MGIVSVEPLTERLHDVAGETELERAVLSTKLRRFQTWCRGVDLVRQENNRIGRARTKRITC